jgi:hypothetical protein
LCGAGALARQLLPASQQIVAHERSLSAYISGGFEIFPAPSTTVEERRFSAA